MSTAQATPFSQWSVQPEATRLIENRLQDYCESNLWLAELQRRLLLETGTRLVDWVDTIHVAADCDWSALGFSAQDPYGQQGRLHHPGAQLPWVIADGVEGIVLRVESVVDFIRAQSIISHSDLNHSLDLTTPILGDSCASRRSAVVSISGGVQVMVLERHGDQGPAIGNSSDRIDPAKVAYHLQQFRLRPRQFDDANEGIQQSIEIARRAADDLGVDRACDLYFQTEREYWQLRNDAAALQYRAQSRLGMGWANHDHHTYRSSRQCFAKLIELLETLGMFCRERFYAGGDANWGAQVLEQPQARVVVFADVDMSADEVLGDFAHDGLPDSLDRGTVGLWCHLHGEAVLQAGMHHLECQFDFQQARQRLAAEGAESLQPFTNFEFLRQSFTRGQIWPVQSSRIQTALDRGWINEEQAKRFRTAGVTGSHLEVLERNDGYKGFNQTGISDIIARTDPRNATMQ